MTTKRTTGRPVTCTGCAQCDPAIAERERILDEAFWAEEDERWNRQREAEEKADAAFWAAQ